MTLTRITSFACGAVLMLLPALEALGKPPPWAPAHGYRAKGDPFYVGYTGRQWPRDYGILGGRCNTDEVLAAVGAVAGGVIGGRVSSPENRVIATILGAVIGGVIGAEVGNRIDDRDRACIAQSLELARTGQTVRWTNPDTGVSYAVKPVQDLADGCREFELSARDGTRSRPTRVTGCSAQPGAWSFR
ncbi:MAG: glycine zipper 2TM domain-containing protein [Pseudomonadales bacterium]|nr:glycine zipper 2TM domain-containing protein [Pseudomonadales bacterium]